MRNRARVIQLRLFVLLQKVFSLPPPDSKAVRVRVLSGDYAGQFGWCYEARRLAAGEIWGCIPVELDSERHVHLTREQVEIVTP